MILWRIAAETRRWRADDLSGAGAAAHPGRWNDEGQPVVYAAPSVSLAVLETAAHLRAVGLPLDRFLVRIDVPDDIWAVRETLDAAQLPPAWAAIPAGRASIDAGSQWLASGRSAVLTAPSVIVPEEHVVLLNPAHADARAFEAEAVRRFEYERLFRP